MGSHSGVFNRLDGVDITAKAKINTLITSILNKPLCHAECLMSCECFMTIYNGNTCDLFNGNAQYYLIKNLTTVGIVYYKKSALNSTLYIMDGELFLAGMCMKGI